jgi:Ni,Fe-hydrogenase III small subunit
MDGLKHLSSPIHNTITTSYSSIHDVSVHVPGTTLTHKQVLEAVRESLKHQKEKTVVSVQFDARNVRVGTMWMNNR